MARLRPWLSPAHSAGLAGRVPGAQAGSLGPRWVCASTTSTNPKPSAQASTWVNPKTGTISTVPFKRPSSGREEGASPGGAGLEEGRVSPLCPPMWGLFLGLAWGRGCRDGCLQGGTASLLPPLHPTRSIPASGRGEGGLLWARFYPKQPGLAFTPSQGLFEAAASFIRSSCFIKKKYIYPLHQNTKSITAYGKQNCHT